MSQVDSKTHDDVKQLIQDEWESHWEDKFDIERLASLIEARLGYESPKKPLFPNITQGEWEGTILDCPLKITADGSLVADNIRKLEDAVLIVAAPKIGELLAEFCANLPEEDVRYNYVKYRSNRTLEEIWEESIKVLRKVGASI